MRWRGFGGCDVERTRVGDTRERNSATALALQPSRQRGNFVRVTAGLRGGE
jgi:hypothetical protein